MNAVLGAAFGLGFGFGCSDGAPAGQVLTGRIDTTHASGVVAIRAVSGSDVVTAAQVASDGSFRITLPTGAKYRLEVLSSGGVKQVLSHGDSGWKAMEVQVCVPSAPFDMGGMGNSGAMCDPSDPNCTPQPDPNCTNPMDPDCKMDPCTTNPMDPSCQPPPSCGGANEPACPPDPCESNPMDPDCKPPDPCESNPMDPNCMGGGCQPGDPNCGGTMDPVCDDPMDPQTCKDPCVLDPMTCGCNAGEPDCWPPPGPPMCDPNNPSMDGGTTMCDPGGTLTPTNVPGNFGCMGLLGGK